ncbi:hypothetical protein [Streptomyces sp. NBC_01190]|uniref:hypothetical protein n=1 Tax=Streptomyces sp. NBC_01190 TaxID=2903767 RepID=UPI003868F955|nr:hypothetical protein OG519_08385 [Streptomyces sp. NBC_01190]
MYEYDVHPLITAEAYVEPEQVPDFPPPRPDEHTDQWDLDGEFEQFFRQSPREDVPLRVVPRVDRRRPRRRVRVRWPTVLSVAVAATTAAIATTVSVLGAMVSYEPLRQLASPTAQGLASSWPLLVYGPWFLGALSVLHAVAHRKQVRGAWLAVILFSLVAMALCIAAAPRTITAVATAGLPPLSALASFHLLFRQITLFHPRHAKLPHQRKH